MSIAKQDTSIQDSNITTNSWSSVRRIFSNNWFSSWTNFVCFCKKKKIEANKNEGSYILSDVKQRKRWTSYRFAKYILLKKTEQDFLCTKQDVSGKYSATFPFFSFRRVEPISLVVN